MSDRRQQTEEMLAKHHRDGERFAQMMKESFDSRFDELFWNAWRQWVEPAYSASPVVLDLGAGPGMFVKALAARYPGIRAIGVEVAPYMLQAVGDLPVGCEIIAEDLHDPKLPLADAAVDAVMCSVVLHEMDQPLRALQEISRVMRPGGRFYIADWVRAPLEVYVRNQTDEAKLFGADITTAELEDFFIHFAEHNRYSREDLIYLLNHTGFAVIHSEIAKEGRYARIVAEKR
ncbi:MAG: class I SAM-dependent methyltransferase [Gammaproteobacteria bacterium HGW-Gammaproteobacteria-1]|jgi:SAM-dependent methyltransferase|nr:MAG: class I SAM-dependent methyltransferase [Gammaproteobacteria bacterium HGW-Gammaproteobacteria-1]